MSSRTGLPGELLAEYPIEPPAEHTGGSLSSGEPLPEEPLEGEPPPLREPEGEPPGQPLAGELGQRPKDLEMLRLLHVPSYMFQGDL